MGGRHLERFADDRVLNFVARSSPFHFRCFGDQFVDERLVQSNVNVKLSMAAATTKRVLAIADGRSVPPPGEMRRGLW
jgi:hypothetical protein